MNSNQMDVCNALSAIESITRNYFKREAHPNMQTPEEVMARIHSICAQNTFSLQRALREITGE